MKILKKILFITFITICASTSLTFAKTGKVKIEATRIRKEANTTSNIVNVIYEDDEVEILEEAGEWCKVKYKNDTGFVKKEFLAIEEKKEEKTKEQEAQTEKPAETKTTEEPKTEEEPKPENNIEIYAKLLPSFVSNNTFKVDFSKQIEQIDELGKWIKISDGQNVGWILKSKLQQGEVPAPEKPKENEANEKTTENITNKVANTNTNTSTNTSVNNAVENTATDKNLSDSKDEKTKVENNVSNSTTSSLNKKATITVETAIVRSKPTTSSDPIGYLDYGNEITLLEQDGEWYKINIENKTGYVKNTLLKINDSSVSSRSATEERKEVAASSEIVEYAKQYLEYPYVVGGKNPTTGFDCSGYTRYVYQNFNYSLGTTASSQANAGTEVNRENMKPGDLIIFQNEGKSGIGHTGIYVGNGDFIHAANPQRGVVIDNLNTNSYYNERFVSARKIID